jgi:hypothetical protein
MTVSHTGTPSNRDKNYAIPVDAHAKQWRLVLSEGGGGRTQLFGWNFERWAPFSLAGPVDPPESILATPWADFGYPFSKVARNLVLTLNTGGVNLSVALQTSEAGTVQTFIVNTTYTTRRIFVACNSNLIGSLWRLVFSPGAGQLAQLWDWSLDYVREPAAVTFIDSYETDMGFPGWKWIKEVWLSYACASTVTFTILVENAVQFFTIVLPAHANRDEEHFFLPAAVGAVLNKSRRYRFQLSSASPIRLYANSSISWLPWLAEQQAGFQHFSLTPEQQLAVAG